MRNALKSRPKKSRIELAMNKYIILIVLIQFLVCISAAAYDCIWIRSRGIDVPYLGYSYAINDQSNFANFMVAFMQWFIAVMNFVPISLLVTVEMVKLTQGMFIESDWMLYDVSKDIYAKV